MNIEKTLNELGSYFKGKVLKGDYELIKVGKHTAEINIDGKYNFNMWIANDPAYCFEFYTLSGFSNMFDDGFLFTNQEDRLKAYSLLKKDIDIYTETIIKKEKTEQFNKLKKELGI